MQSGLVSITFRKLSPGEIIQLMVEHQLVGVEWGGDVHVPPGDLENAQRVGAATRDAGLTVAAYGSYYRCLPNPEQTPSAVVDTAQALGAPLIRVWAGNEGSAGIAPEKRAKVTANLSVLVNLAEKVGIKVALEFHAKTLTDDIGSTIDLLKAIDHPNLGTLWQPPKGMSFEEAKEGLESILPWLCNLHVFSWTLDADGKTIRHPLAQAADRWPAYLAAAKSASPAFAMLEFVREDSTEQFAEDAALLNQWLGSL